MVKKIRVTDYIANRIYELGVKHVFTLTGGGAMFLNDGIACHPHLKAVCNHHEQACSQGAVAYSKLKNDFSVVMPTTGCGGTNAITGLLDAWQDNLPCIFISGQINKMQTCYNSKTNLRQFGVQEANIVEIVKSITKYSIMVNDPEEIAYHLDKAFYLSSTGRKGPVWIDVPMDVAASFVEPDELKRFKPKKPKKEISNFDKLKNLFKQSNRPVILAGNGVRLASACKELKDFAEKYNIPVVNTFLGTDLLDGDNTLKIGTIGIKGTRAANFAMQNSDLLLVIGSRLGVPVTGYKYEMFARDATTVVVDIDPAEHKKDTIKIDLFYESDAKDFLSTFKCNHKFSIEWAQQCFTWKKKWPVILPEYEDDKGGISLYYFMKKLGDFLEDDSVVVSDAGSAFYITAQALDYKKNQRHITSGAQAEMGFTVPASIGASFAKNKGKVIGITGDGSFQTNIQELQTILYHKLPIKTFVLNNNGYLSIRTTQQKFFEGRLIGTDKDSGVSFPDTKKIAEAYGIKYVIMKDNIDLNKKLTDVIKSNEPIICEIMCKEKDKVIPTLSAKKNADGKLISKPLEDMYPFLDRKEFHENMYIIPLDE